MQEFQHAQAPFQDPRCISVESHSLACAPLPSSNASMAVPHSGPKFSRLRSVLSKVLPTPARSKLHIPARSKLDALAHCFPDFTHPSSDAELSAEAVSVTPELHAQYQHSMDILHSSHPHPIANFPSVNVPSAMPGTAKTEALLLSQERRRHPQSLYRDSA